MKMLQAALNTAALERIIAGKSKCVPLEVPATNRLVIYSGNLLKLLWTNFIIRGRTKKKRCLESKKKY